MLCPTGAAGGHPRGSGLLIGGNVAFPLQRGVDNDDGELQQMTENALGIVAVTHQQNPDALSGKMME